MTTFLQRAAALIGGLLLTLGAAQAGSYTVAVVPQFPAVEIHRAWTPVLQRLSAQTGHEFKLVPQHSIPAFEASFRAGQPDFVFLNPYHMVMAREAQQYKPLVRDAALLHGVLVVGAQSPVRRLEDLRGAAIAFPSPNAFGASLYLRALLAERGIEIQPRYVKTHSNAYRHVLTGQAVAAGGVQLTLDHEEASVRAGLRVLFETPATPPHPLAAHPRVPADVQAAVRDTLLGWAKAQADSPLLHQVQMRAPVPADYRRDYEPLERLRLASFVVVEGP